MTRLHYNLVRSALDGAIDDTVTTFDITAPLREGGNLGALIPDVSGGNVLAIRVDDEIMHVTAYTSGSSTITTVSRGEDDTVPAAHSDAAVVKHVIAKADVVALGVRDRLWLPGDDPYGLDDEFNDSSLDAAWTRVDRSGNSAGLTWTEDADVLSLLHNSGTDNSSELHVLLKSLGGLSAPVTIETATRVFAPYATNYTMTGLCLADGTTYGAGKQIITMPFAYSGIAGPGRLSVRSYTGFDTGITVFGDADYDVGGGTPLFQRLKWTAANTFEAWFSPDGVSWLRFPNSTQSYTMTPTHFGLLHSHWGSALRSVTTFDYVRVF